MEVKSLVSWLVMSVFLIGCSAGKATADAIWIKGQDQPIFGIVDASDDQQIKFRQTTDGINFQPTTINRSSIRVLVINHDSRQLSSLPQGEWQPWLELAEELHSQQRDPTARNLAIRLLLSVAANSNEKMQRSVAFDGLVSLARTEDEREKFRQLRFVETGKGTLPSPVAKSSQEHSSESRKAAADLVRRVRLEEFKASELASSSLERNVISSFENICSWQELIQISNANRVDDQSLKRLVALELELRLPKKARVLKKAKTQWHELAGRIGTSTLSLPSIEDVTEFDPFATRFVDGKWLKR